MILRTKRIAAMLVFFVLSTTAVMAQAGQTKVTDAELTKFADTFQQMRMMNQKAQMQMSQAIQEENLDIKRFNEIHKAELDPAVASDATKEEKEKYGRVIAKIEKMQVSFEGDMEELIKDSGLTVDRYQEIATSLQTNPQLQERLKEELTSE
ncbi:MAG: DUF4168 domain-containing protein [Salinimicrobium sp.]